MSGGKLILASGSPRRREILTLAGASFTVAPAGADESLPAGTAPADAVVLLAGRKAAAAVRAAGDADYILGADTVVDLDGVIFGKPSDRADAARMLRAMSGRTHRVLTGICVIRGGKSAGLSEATYVSVRKLTEDDIEWYLGHENVFDKAGAYAIQGVFSTFVSGIRGDYFNVMGLPVCALDTLLRSEFGTGLRDFN